MTKESIRERLVVSRSLLEDLLFGEIDEDDRLDFRKRLLPGELKSTALVQLDGSSAGGDERPFQVETSSGGVDVEGGLRGGEEQERKR